MEKLKYYLKEVLRISITLEPVESLQKLPFYIREGFKLYYARFYNSELIFAEVKNEQGFTTSQVEKHTQFLKEIFNRKTYFHLHSLYFFIKFSIVANLSNNIPLSNWQRS